MPECGAVKPAETGFTQMYLVCGVKQEEQHSLS